MTVEAFVDTNVLLYAASRNPMEATKKARANRLIGDVAFGTSAQVLAEFYNAVTRKGQSPMPPAEALRWIEVLILQPCVALDPDIVIRGAELSHRYRISYWDGAIIAAAEVLGATTLFTEDLSHGQIYGTVRAENPFRGP